MSQNLFNKQEMADIAGYNNLHQYEFKATFGPFMSPRIMSAVYLNNQFVDSIFEANAVEGYIIKQIPAYTHEKNEMPLMVREHNNEGLKDLFRLRLEGEVRILKIKLNDSKDKMKPIKHNIDYFELLNTRGIAIPNLI